MKIGIYCSYWDKEWGGDPIPLIKKVRALGFDVLEVACANFDQLPDNYFDKMRKEAEKYEIILTGGYGPIPEHNIASRNPAIVRNGFDFYSNIFPKMQRAGIKTLGGALYSYWPVDFSGEINKAADTSFSIGNMKRIADLAERYNITLLMESLNRFEGYIINTAKEAVDYVNAVNRENVKLLLDTFHMNIEEDNILDAIRTCGSYLGELHVGEANRRPPREDGLPWDKIVKVLKEIAFDGNIVMEPFVNQGGKVGQDIKVWRNLLADDKEETLDQAAGASVQYLKRLVETV